MKVSGVTFAWWRVLLTRLECRCSAGCSTLRQWDLTRAVPRLVRDVKLEKGDIMGIATRKGFVYTCGADGSIRWAACPPPCLPGFWRCQVCLLSTIISVHPS